MLQGEYFEKYTCKSYGSVSSKGSDEYIVGLFRAFASCKHKEWKKGAQ